MTRLFNASMAPPSASTLRLKDRELYRELFGCTAPHEGLVEEDRWEILCAWRDFIATLTFNKNELISDWENGVIENELRRIGS